MRKSSNNSVWLPALLLGLGLMAAGVASAQSSLYEGEVMVTTQSEGERAAVLPQALSQVLVKLSGDPDATRLPSVQARLADARILMQQFRYRQAMERSDGVLQQRLYLVAGFDNAGVDRLMAEVGLPLWPSPRPHPMVWLAIDDGSGARLVSSTQAGSLAPLTRSAEQRGLTLEFPLLDAEDRQQIDVRDVLSGRADALQAAAARYDTKVLLSGSLLRRSSGWESSWQLRDRGQVLDQWQTSDSDPANLLADASARSANALAARYASPVFIGEPADYTVAIDGLTSAQDFARALGYVRSLGIVRSALPIASDDNELQLRVSLVSTIDGLRHMIELSDVLLDVSDQRTSPSSQPVDARFSLQR